MLAKYLRLCNWATICVVLAFHGVSEPLLAKSSVNLSQTPEHSITVAEQLLRQGYEQFQAKQYKAALSSYDQVFTICQQIKHLECMTKALDSKGFVHASIGQYPQAAESFQKALVILRQRDDRNREAIALNNLAAVHQRMGQYSKALEIAQQALVLYRQLGDRVGEGFALNNVGGIYQSLGKYPQALDFFQQAIALYQTQGDQAAIANGVSNIGLVHSYLGDYPKALELFHQALGIQENVGNLPGQSATLQYIGFVYRQLNQESKALEFYQKSLAIRRSLSNKDGVAEVLNNIGESYERLGQYSQALQSLEEALTLARTLNGRDHEGNIIDNLATVYKRLGQYPKATLLYQQALAIEREVGNRTSERITLSNIGDLLKQQNNPGLAIVFYKQSVDLTEVIRQDLRVLPREQQESYTRSVADTYRRLADLLLQQDRVLEAQQILDLLKLQELDDYLRDVRGTGQRIEFLQPEVEILKRHSELQKNAIQVGSELAELRKLDSQNALPPAQQQRLSQLAKLETEINAQFNAFIDSDPIQQLTAQLSRGTRNQNLNLEDLASLRDDLRQLNAALLYPLILDDRLELVITTPNAPPLRRVVKLKREDLNRTIQQFRSALGKRQDNAQALAQQLYTWLIQPLEADLKQANVKTIIYAPDGQLRYIPLAALHNGKQWLIQQYRIQNITARSVTDLNARPISQPKVFAAAFGAKELTVAVENESFRFGGLPFAGKEVQALAQRFDRAVSLFDVSFNREALLTRMNSFTIVHLATHGKFLIGKPDNSFLVTGDGKPINLKEIKNLPMSNVDLVVLSACETGLGLTDQANGVEVLGLGYQFQRAGAKAAIASLWQVNDGSTQQFMDVFYGLLQKGLTKAEALQQAQIALITGDFTAGGKLRGNFRIETTSNQTAIATSLKHPFYWAPFILIGNGL